MEKLNVALSRFERAFLIDALQRTGWKKSKTAESLGISRKNLWEKLKRYAITRAAEEARLDTPITPPAFVGEGSLDRPTATPVVINVDHNTSGAW